MGSRAAEAKRHYLRWNEDCDLIAWKLAELERQREEAAAQGDFTRWAQLRQQQQECEESSTSAASEELQHVRYGMKQAAQAERFEQVSGLKKEEQELAAQIRSEDEQGITAALRLLLLHESD